MGREVAVSGGGVQTGPQDSRLWVWEVRGPQEEWGVQEGQVAGGGQKP